MLHPALARVQSRGADAPRAISLPVIVSIPAIMAPGLPSVAPPSVRPSPRPDVSPPATGTFLLYAQGQQIGYLPLNGTRLQKEEAKTLLSLHVQYHGGSVRPPEGGS